MVAIARVRVSLTGFVGGPGVSTFYAIDPIALITPLRAYFVAMMSLQPAPVTAQVVTSGDYIESTSGALGGAWTTTGVTPVLGNSASMYSGVSGLAVTWLTATIADGKRVRGRTFHVPLSQEQYQTDGTIGAGAVSAATTAGNNLILATPGNLVIWHRPRTAKAATPTSLAVTARLGSHAVVTSARVTDKAAILRSRRD